MSRVDQINELLHKELADLISREIYLDNGLITISYVDCSPDLRHAKIAVSVLPENITGTALEKLRKASGGFAGVLKKKLRLKMIPKFIWEFDPTEKEAAVIDRMFDEIFPKD